MILEKFNLKDKLAIVTGTRRGIGQGLAIGLAEAGADVISFDRNDPVDTREKIQGAGRKHYWKQVDVLAATPAELQEQVRLVAEEFGRLDILVNNAGICPRQDLLTYPEEYWTDTVKTDLTAPWFLAQAAARIMVKQGHGKIINVGSLLSHQGGIWVPGYAAAKHGVLGMTKALANELASRGINVNAIVPGYIMTDFTAPLNQDPQRNRDISARIPQGRWGVPEDLAGTCVFLASAASDYLNGIDIPVDGGWMGR